MVLKKVIIIYLFLESSFAFAFSNTNVIDYFPINSDTSLFSFDHTVHANDILSAQKNSRSEYLENKNFSIEYFENYYGKKKIFKTLNKYEKFELDDVYGENSLISFDYIYLDSELFNYLDAWDNFWSIGIDFIDENKTNKNNQFNSNASFGFRRTFNSWLYKITQEYGFKFRNSVSNQEIIMNSYFANFMYSKAVTENLAYGLSSSINFVQHNYLNKNIFNLDLKSNITRKLSRNILLSGGINLTKNSDQIHFNLKDSILKNYHFNKSSAEISLKINYIINNSPLQIDKTENINEKINFEIKKSNLNSDNDVNKVNKISENLQNESLTNYALSFAEKFDQY